MQDGETILHEFGHSLRDAICPDFGQSAEAAAMGEGFGDYFAASFFASRKATGKRLLDAVMTWDGLLFADERPGAASLRPSSRRTAHLRELRPLAAGRRAR